MTGKQLLHWRYVKLAHYVYGSNFQLYEHTPLSAISPQLLVSE